MSDPFDFLPNDWSDFEKRLWDDFPDDVVDDRIAQAMYNDAYFNHDLTSDDRMAIRSAFSDYLDQEYGIDFDQIFDWDAWRDAYEGEG